MVVWEEFVDILRVAIFAYAQACGGNLGLGIISVTLLVRLAMLPLTLRLARVTATHQQLMKKLKPELDRLRVRFKDRPQTLAEETRRLFEKEGASPLPLAGCAGTFVQLPIVVGLYSAVRRCVVAGGRFLWIRNIAIPDLLLTVAVTALTMVTLAVGASSTGPNKAIAVVIPTAITFLVLSKLAAGIGLYWGVSLLVSLLQTGLIRWKPQAIGNGKLRTDN